MANRNDEKDPVLLLLGKIRSQIDDVVDLVKSERQQMEDDRAAKQ